MDENNGRKQETAMIAPSFRLWLCGTFRVERRSGTSYEVVRTIEWGGSSYPRLLLKALVCRPGRQARREALMELLWPECDPEQAVQNLNTATTKLRAVLRPTKEQDSLLLTENDATMYRLAGQERLWVDADAALDVLKQAEYLDRGSTDTLALLEEAEGYFRQGPFQQEEEGQWVTGRRATIEQARYRCRLWLAEAYVLRHMPGQATTILSLMLEEDPLDEDILCRLMTLLQQQGMTHRAMRYYQSTCAMLACEGLEPAEATRDFARRIQANRQSLSETFLSAQNIQLGRREASRTLATIGVGLFTLPPFGLMQVGTLLHDEEILTLSAASIPPLWRLYFDGHLAEVQHILPGYLSQVSLLVRQPSRYQQQAAAVASPLHQLACMLALQEQDYGLAFIHVDQAIWEAKRTENPHLQVTSLIRKALIYRYINRHLKTCPSQIVETYQEAEQYCSSVSPLLRGRVSMGLSEAHSELGQEYEAQRALEKAYTVFPEHPQDDPHFSYTHFKLPRGFEVVMYLNLKQAKKAWDILEEMNTVIPMDLVPDRVEVSVDQAKAAFLLGDMPQSCTYVESAATSATALGSQLRHREAYSIYRHMQRQWPREPQVKALAEHFHKGRIDMAQSRTT